MIGWVAGAMLGASALQPISGGSAIVGDVRFQDIRKAPGEKEWPFVAKEGRLACVMSLGQPLVYFFPPFDGKKHRPFALSVHVVEMGIVNFGMPGVLAPFDSYEQLIKRIAPFVAMGNMLCKQNSGPIVPGNEL